MHSPTRVRIAIGAAFLAGTMLGTVGTGFSATILGSDIFTDVEEGAYYDKAIGEMYNDGIVKGLDSRRFGPNDFITRGQVAVMLQRFRDEMDLESDNSEEEEEDDERSSSSRTSSVRSSSQSSVPSTNEQGIFRFTTSSYKVNENTATLTIGIVRTGGNKGSVSVEYEVTGGSATAGTDFETISGKLDFATKETSKVITLKIKDDSTAEGDETATITLKSPTNGAIIGSPTATITIVDNESGGGSSGGSSRSSSSGGNSSSTNTNGTISFNALTFGVDEDAGSITITVKREGGTSGTVGVNYATSNGSGNSGTEYTQASGTLTFASGETSKTFTVNIVNDSSVDGTKTFNVTLSSPSGGANLGTSSAVVSINDDEGNTSFGSGSIKFGKASYDVTESDAKAVVTVQRLGGTNGTVSVNYSTTNGTAFSGADYTTTSGTLTFQPGESSKSLTIPIVKDSGNEEDDYFYVDLTNATNNVPLLSPYTTTINIYD